MALLVPHPRSYAKGQDWTDEASPSNTNMGTTVTASATPHALTGTPTQIIATTSYEAEWLEVTIHNTSTATTLTDALLNVYIGAGGSEVLFIDSMAVSNGVTSVTATVDASDQTQRQNIQATGGTTGFRQRGATSTAAGIVGTRTMNWTLSTSKAWATQTVEVLEVSATARLRTLMGVGT
jgi:hypothetical protein